MAGAPEVQSGASRASWYSRRAGVTFVLRARARIAAADDFGARVVAGRCLCAPSRSESGFCTDSSMADRKLQAPYLRLGDEHDDRGGRFRVDLVGVAAGALHASLAWQTPPACGVRHRTNGPTGQDQFAVRFGRHSKAKLAGSVHLMFPNQHVAFDRWSDRPQHLVAAPGTVAKSVQWMVQWSHVV